MMLLVAGALVAAVLLTGCTGSSQRPAAEQSASPVQPATETGVATGEVPLCLGVAIASAVTPQTVTVRATRGGEVVATQQVAASGTEPGRYRFVLAPGLYSIEAPSEYDGPTVAHVGPGSTVTADLANACK